MHFLKKLVEHPGLQDPVKQHMDIHRHFYRYSRGEFIGPAIKISCSSTKITLKGSHEYEDLIIEIIAKSIEDPKQEFEIRGRIVTGSDISEQLTKLGLNWKLKESTGKTKNYKSDFIDKITRDKLIECNSSFRTNSYFLVNFNLGSTCKVSTKKNIPQPSKKKVEDDDASKRIQFSTGYLRNTGKNLELVIDSVIPDFKKQIPNDWKNIMVYNNYLIDDIEVPKNIKDTRLLRIFAIRKGKIIRTIEIDGESYENQFPFLA
jgi:hypothetical protein